MPNPKRRHSHSRTHKRRTHQVLTAPSLVACPQCKSLKPTFRVCPFCGYYKDKPVLVIKKKTKDKK